MSATAVSLAPPNKGRWLLAVAASFALMLGVGASSAAAADFTVTTTADPSIGSCGPASCSLRQAVTAANAGTGGTIHVPPGDYTLSRGIALAPTKALTIAGVGARVTIIHGTPASRVISGMTGTPLTLAGVTIRDGQAAGGGGVLWDGDLTVIDSAVLDNVATGAGARGGGIESFGGTLTLSRSLVAGNRAGDGAKTDAPGGGGIDVEQAGVITNSTIAGNTAPGGTNSRGGGIAVLGRTPLTMTNVTITGNSAGFGSGAAGGLGGNIDVESNAISLRNTIVAAGSGGAGVENCGYAGNGTITTLGHNLESAATCRLTSASDLHTDAALGTLGNNGGPTDTEAPLGTSPVLGAANPTQCPSPDQRGVRRPQLGTCDIGAYQHAAPTVTTEGAASGATATARVTGTVAPNFRPTTYRFQYGTTTAYGTTTRTLGIAGGTTPIAVAAQLAGLARSTTYHYRLVAASDEGTSFGGDRTFTAGAPPKAAARPVVRSLVLTPAHFRAAHSGPSIAAVKTGAALSYRVSEPAVTTFTVDRLARGVRSGNRCVAPSPGAHHGQRCTRLIAIHGGFTERGRPGLIRFRFSGRIAGRTLGAGAYRLAVTPRALKGSLGRTVTANFQIVR